jgi:hypothetical protein
MDSKLVAIEPKKDFGDLWVLEEQEIAYQKDISKLVDYNSEYFDKYIHYEGTELANKINDGRIALSTKYAAPISSVLDIGIGSGEFIKTGYKKTKTLFYGFDINSKAIVWLKNMRLWVDPYDHIHANMNVICCWDSLEHMPDPEKFLNVFKSGMYLITSIPIFKNIWKIKDSKHYRPGEHLVYFTDKGLKNYLGMYDFEFIEHQDFEIQAGREAIETFVFQKR